MSNLKKLKPVHFLIIVIAVIGLGLLIYNQSKKPTVVDDTTSTDVTVYGVSVAKDDDPNDPKGVACSPASCYCESGSKGDTLMTVKLIIQNCSDQDTTISNLIVTPKWSPLYHIGVDTIENLFISSGTNSAVQALTFNNRHKHTLHDIKVEFQYSNGQNSIYLKNACTGTVSSCPN